MEKKLKKQQQRLGWIATNTLFQLLGLSWTFLMAYFVIDNSSLAVWGRMVPYLIVVNVLSMLLNWGQNGYLSRLFSQDSRHRFKHWQSSVLSRGVLLFIVLASLMLCWQDPLVSWVAGWLVLSFCSRSFDPLHLYERQFVRLIIIEVLALFVLTGFFILVQPPISTRLLIQAYLCLLTLRSLAYLFFYRNYWWIAPKGTANLSYFVAAFPFFIPAMVGFLQSRIDLYAVSIYLEEEAVGTYQIFFKIIALFLMFSRMLAGPFYKNLYRLPYRAFMRLNRQVMLVAAIVVGPLLMVFKILLAIFFSIELEGVVYGLAYAVIVPFYGYFILANLLIRYHKEYQVLGLFVLGSFLGLLLNWIMVPTYGIIGALLATVLVQCTLWCLFRILCQRLKNKLDQNSGS